MTRANPGLSPTSTALASRVLTGEPRAIARAISLIENDGPDAPSLMRAIFGRTGRAFLIGVTGPPGAGKSTLVDRITGVLRDRPTQGPDGPARTPRDATTVGVIAVDPTSPFTGGAVLGDRVRMQAQATDPGVFIRSMATRGHLGGLARATLDAALVLDAAGKDVVLIETVGVGQDEIDIVRTADVSIVVLIPGTGDDVQALKAGIMEIADIFVVNKCDREGADRLVSAVEASLSLHAYGPADWRPPIIRTTATTGQGVAPLLEAVDRFRAHATDTRDARRRARSEFKLRELVTSRFLERLQLDVLEEGELGSLVTRIADRKLDPYTAADQLLARALKRSGD